MMFTNLFNNEEKEKFLELIFKIAHCDGDYAEEEEELINNYKIELNISDIKDTASIDELVIYFGRKSDKIKKIVLFELYGMMMADANIADEEKHILDLIKFEFKFKDEVYDSIIDAATELQNVYDKIYDVLF